MLCSELLAWAGDLNFRVQGADDSKVGGGTAVVLICPHLSTLVLLHMLHLPAPHAVVGVPQARALIRTGQLDELFAQDELRNVMRDGLAFEVKMVWLSCLSSYCVGARQDMKLENGAA